MQLIIKFKGGVGFIWQPHLLLFLMKLLFVSVVFWD